MIPDIKQTNLVSEGETINQWWQYTVLNVIMAQSTMGFQNGYLIRPERKSIKTILRMG